MNLMYPPYNRFYYKVLYYTDQTAILQRMLQYCSLISVVKNFVIKSPLYNRIS
jgi:hypothetical protein